MKEHPKMKDIHKFIEKHFPEMPLTVMLIGIIIELIFMILLILA